MKTGGLQVPACLCLETSLHGETLSKKKKKKKKKENSLPLPGGYIELIVAKERESLCMYASGNDVAYISLNYTTKFVKAQNQTTKRTHS